MTGRVGIRLVAYGMCESGGGTGSSQSRPPILVKGQERQLSSASTTSSVVCDEEDTPCPAPAVPPMLGYRVSRTPLL